MRHRFPPLPLSRIQPPGIGSSGFVSFSYIFVMQPEEVAPVLAQNVICFVVICHGARGASSGFQQKIRIFRYFYANYNEKYEYSIENSYFSL